MSGRLHMRRDRYDGEGLDMKFGLCGLPGVDVTDDPGLVRCRLCRARMDAPELEAPAVVEEPFVPGPPVPVVRGAHELDEHTQHIVDRFDAGEEPPRWRSLMAAIRKTTEIKAGRSPIRSSWKAEQESRSEGAVRNDGGRDDVIEIDQAFARSFRRPFTCGALSVSADVACRILELVLRGQATAAQVAEDIGEGVTAHQVGKLISAGKSSMREQLEAKGLVERTARVSSTAETLDVEGWKAIADVVKRSESSVKRYAARETDPLPAVMHLGRVSGNRDELLAWSKRQGRSQRAA